MFRGEIRELDQTYADPIAYEWRLSTESPPINDWIGREVRVQFTGARRCIACGRTVSKLFQSGYCFPCVRSLAECDLCIVKPHECRFHNGTCRDEEFGRSHCMIPHYVYLAWSSGYKVGLTRKGRQLKRWMDQGATFGLVIAEIPTRKQAGELEMEIAKHIPDKTDWRKMLKEEIAPEISLFDLREQVVERLDDNFQSYLLNDSLEVREFRYPRDESLKVNLKSVNFDKEPIFSGMLLGVKGQYLLFDSGVMNVKKFAGYEVMIDVI